MAESRLLLANTHAATMEAGQAGCGLVRDAVIAIDGANIVWVGSQDELPRDYRDWPQRDLGGRLVTPALIDCHTHIVYSGNRTHEFERRQAGDSYAAIARTGGGILSTVRATRAASESQLLSESLPRVDALLGEGVATIEIKSGYGLDLESELKMLRVARRIGAERNVRVTTTFLGAHAIPPEFEPDGDAYVNHVCDVILPAACDAGLVDAVDVFCENIAFTLDQSRRVLKCALDLGLPVKAHSEQLSRSGSASLVATMGGLSADHLEYLDDSGVAAMAESGTVAVLLPGAYYWLGGDVAPPVAALRDAGVSMAVASDANPGSSPLTSPLLAMNFASKLFGLTADESLAGMTRCAALALGMGDKLGTIGAGRRAEFAIWDAETPAEIVFQLGGEPLAERLIGGQ